MDAQVPALPDLAPGDTHRFLVMARPALADAGFMEHRSTYKGSIKESASPKARARGSSTAISRVEHTSFWIKVSSPRSEPIHSYQIYA